MVRQICESFTDVDVTEAYDAYFLFYNPPDSEPDHRMPFATVVSSNANDPASDLDRPGVFRLNVGVEKETYRSLFGPLPKLGESGLVDTGHDFTQLDVLMPHPVYAPQSWICALNPSPDTLEKLQPLLAEAYQLAVNRRTRTR
jgi:hypothetical protein